MKARLLFLAIAVAAAALGGGCIDNSDPYGLKDMPAPAPEASAASTGTGQPAAKVAPSKVGQPASVGTWLVVVKKVEIASGVPGIEAKAGKEMVVLTVGVTNGGALNEDTHPDFFTLVGPDGTKHKPVKVEDATFIHGTAEPIIAGEAREVFMAFSVDKGDGPFQLTYLPMSEEGKSEPAVIDVP
ncbi:MAG: hypothetical protein CVT67_04010 [Actinobacteria bacterium HGW-Actinobacteria-7]|jgi:hypothetical protein|nr:MAG: hypothetical protein CVT67_04010 [Actinobacteria bacterium HGW-Actinobacteria-7]